MSFEQSQNMPADTILDHLRRTMKLAGPVIVTRLGGLFVIVVDTAMTGHYSTTELAYLSIGGAPMITMLVIGIGVLAGTSILVAQACGAGEPELSGNIWRISCWNALVLGVLAAFLCQFGETFFLLVGQNPGLAKGAGNVLALYGWQLIPFFFAISASMFLEAIHKPQIGAIIMIIANVLNIGLNWMLIYGFESSAFSIAAMGAEGAVIATLLTRGFIAGCLIWFILTMRDRDTFGVGRRVGEIRDIALKLWRLGLPLGLIHGLESSAFSAVTLFAGLLGTVEASTYQLTNMLVALAFMTAIGTSTAASIRVGNAVGRNDPHGVKTAGWSAFSIVIVFSGLFCALFLLFPEPLARLFTDDMTVIKLATITIGIAGIYLIFDGMQAVMIGALRGRADVWVPTIIQLFSFWVIAVPGAYYMSLVLDYGVQGLMYGIMAGVTFSAVFNTYRFHLVAKKPLRRY